MTDTERAALFAAIAAHLRASNTHLSVVRVCACCGQPFRPRPVGEGSYCNDCVPR